ncbi:MAG TPA: hypothetical protein VLM37_08465, partial [Fibrobacteraceae bacterium]|nr:hypothetical protein [Fibrobacteraceae bacterium]
MVKTLQKISLILVVLLLISCFEEEEEDKLQQALEQCTEVDMNPSSSYFGRTELLVSSLLNYSCYDLELDSSFPTDQFLMDSLGIGQYYVMDHMEYRRYRSPLDTDVIIQLRTPIGMSSGLRVPQKEILFCVHRWECELMDCDSDLAQVWYDQ